MPSETDAKTGYAGACMLKSDKKCAKKVILAVEDDQAMRKFYQSALDDDYDIIVVSSGEDAFKQLNVLGKVDLMVLDFSLPGMSGEAVLNKMKGAFPAVPVLIVSAHKIDDDIEKKLSTPGTYEYLEKPFELEDLMNKIKTNIKA